MAAIFRTLKEVRWWDGTSVSDPLFTPKIVTATDGTTRDIEEMRLYVGDDAPPQGTVHATLTASPNPAARFATVTLNASATGGVAPYNYSFTALTSGITLSGSGNVRTFAVPATGTSWRVQVVVTDSTPGQPLASVAIVTVTLAATTLKTFPGLLTLTRVGMSAPRDLWTQRASEVGPGLTARRIFCDFVSNGRDQADLIEQAIADGMLPVVSYKGTPSTTDSIVATADYLESLGVPIATVRWHEPRGDTALGSTDAAQAAKWVELQQEWAPIFKRPNLSRGCFMNGFLLDGANGRAKWDLFVSDALLDDDIFDWVGIDAYQASPDQLGNTNRPWPGDRIRSLIAHMDERGYPEYRLAVGEYNGYVADVIRDAGEAMLSEPRCWLGMVFNSNSGGKGIPLTHDTVYGDRLAAFQQTLSDPRSA